MLISPWIAATPWQRGFGVALYGLMIVLVAGFGMVRTPHPGAWVHDVGPLAFGVGYASVMLLTNSLLLMRTARHACLPKVQRALVWGVLAWVLLGVLVPVGLLGLAGGDLLVAMVAMLLAVGMALLYALSFGLLNIVLLGMWVLVVGSHDGLRPMLTSPWFPPCGAGAVLLLGGLVVHRWRALVLMPDLAALGRHRPLILQLQARRMGGALTSGSRLLDSSDGGAGFQASAWRQWLRPRTDLQRAGPAAPVAALRVAIGGLFLPQTVSGRMRQAALGMVLLLVVMPMLWVINHQHAPWPALNTGNVLAQIFDPAL